MYLVEKKMKTILFVFLVLITKAFSIKVRERFTEDISGVNIKILITDNELIRTRPESRNSFGQVYVEAVNLIAKKYKFGNVTYHYRQDVEAGYPDKYGNYTGFIGMLQRGESDFALQFLRPDALINEPVTISAVVAPGDFLIVTSRQPPTELAIDVLQALDNADSLALVTFAVAIVITTTLLAFFMLYEKHIKTKSSVNDVSLITQFNTNLAEVYWQVWGLTIDQEAFEPPNWPSRWLWLHFVLAAFIGIFGTWLNLMSTDIVALRPVPQINSFDDVLSEDFQHIQPVVMRELYLYPMLVKSEEGSKYHALLQKVNRNESVVSTAMSFTNLNFLLSTKIEKAVDENSACFLSVEFLFRIALQKFLCVTRPQVMSKMRIADNMFGGGIVTFFMRKGIHPTIRLILDYNLRAIHEASIANEFGKNALSGLEKSLSFDETWNSIKCMMNLKGEGDSSPDSIILRSAALENIMTYCGYIIAAALMALAIEFTMYYRRSIFRYMKRFFVRYFGCILSGLFPMVSNLIYKIETLALKFAIWKSLI